MTRPLVIGSRGSDLALWQAHHVEALLRDAGATSEIRIIRTQGDRIQHLSFDKMEGKGFFTKELEDALLAGEIDLAVHSQKDLPTESPPGLAIAAIPSGRASARELFLVRPEAHAPGRWPLPVRDGARVGTSAARRKAQLRHLRPDVEVVPLRGNVPTRVRKLREDDLDAILLAVAGVSRLELSLDGLVTVPLPIDAFVPAPAQGALAIQTRDDDRAVRDVVARLHDGSLAAVIDAERSLLGRFGGGCSLPLGVHLRADGEGHRLDAFYGPDHGPSRRVILTGSDPVALANEAARRLGAPDPGSGASSGDAGTSDPRAGSGDRTAPGARAASVDGPLAGRRVVVTRPADPTDALTLGLADAGASVITAPAITLAPIEVDLARTLDGWGDGDWIAFTSAAGVRWFALRLAEGGRAWPAGVRIAAIGPATRAALAAHEVVTDLTPPEAHGESLLAALCDALEGATRVLLPGAEATRDVLPDGLRDAGHEALPLPLYRTVPADPGPDRATLDGADLVTFCSPSAVTAFLARATVPPGARVATIGPVTTRAARDAGLEVAIEASPHTADGLVAAIIAATT